MSRAININVSPEAVKTLCDKHSIAISTLEPLQSGGVRIVLLNSDGAEELRRRMKDKILTGPVTRSGLYLARKPVAPHR
jgi:hypothetical protein